MITLTVQQLATLELPNGGCSQLAPGHVLLKLICLKNAPRHPWKSTLAVDTTADDVTTWAVGFESPAAVLAYGRIPDLFDQVEQLADVAGQVAKCRELFRPSAQPGHLSE